jgi:hypothetical protein
MMNPIIENIINHLAVPSIEYLVADNGISSSRPVFLFSCVSVVFDFLFFLNFSSLGGVFDVMTIALVMHDAMSIVIEAIMDPQNISVLSVLFVKEKN